MEKAGRGVFIRKEISGLGSLAIDPEFPGRRGKEEDKRQRKANIRWESVLLPPSRAMRPLTVSVPRSHSWTEITSTFGNTKIDRHREK